MAARVSLDDKYGLDRGCVLSADSYKPYRDGPPSNYRGQCQRCSITTTARLHRPQLCLRSAHLGLLVPWFLALFGQFWPYTYKCHSDILRVGVKLTKKIK